MKVYVKLLMIFLVRNASLGSVYIMNLFSLSWDVSSNNGDIDNSLFVLNVYFNFLYHMLIFKFRK